VRGSALVYDCEFGLGNAGNGGSSPVAAGRGETGERVHEKLFSVK